ncbi:alanine racemase [Enterococcus avium]|uniref:alanine racemase n=1 Tax=Enterococcus avium TaxID=33945 RepID=UPI0028921B1F|nr:alanine racemase [Enterococcus avium]MDT2485074.1 alanine racemase [Enterococcus avium]MDT2511432.1 alanine racemase [Enterococcus avium]
MGSYNNRNYMEVDLKKIKQNAFQIKKYIGTTKLMSVVKTDAYGFGIDTIPKHIELYSDWFAVATSEEALAIREQNIQKPILVLGYVMDSQISEMIQNNVTLTTVSLAYVEHLNELVPEGKKLDVHIKIDTGMNRIGLYSKNHDLVRFVEQAEKILALKNINVTGIYTHFAAAGSTKDEDIEFTKHQYHTFKSVVQQLEALGYELGVRHCSNSDAILNYPEFNMDMVRVGKFFFGFGQDAAIKELGTTLPFKLVGRVIRVKEISKGETVSYDRAFTAEKLTKIATISIGFGDGLRKNMYKELEIIVNGKRAHVTGKINMDFMMVDVTDISDVNEGDYALIIGTGGSETIMPYEVARIAEASTPEIISVVNKRVPRFYINDDE